jgi:dUTP pyrophosphatase
MKIDKIKVMLDDGAKTLIPTRAHDTDAGLDLYSPIDCWLFANDGRHKCYVEIDTGVHIQIPVGYVGDVKSKSGLMMKHHITTDGTVDCGYTGSIRVKLFNHGVHPVKIEKGQKIAQLVIKKIITPELELVDSLEETERGANGFGSSGKF